MSEFVLDNGEYFLNLLNKYFQPQGRAHCSRELAQDGDWQVGIVCILISVEWNYDEQDTHADQMHINCWQPTNRKNCPHQVDFLPFHSRTVRKLMKEKSDCNLSFLNGIVQLFLLLFMMQTWSDKFNINLILTETTKTLNLFLERTRD